MSAQLFDESVLFTWRRWSLALVAIGAVLLTAPTDIRAQDLGEPLLRLEAGGPTSYVTALAFSPDGRTLFAGSWDKTVRVWRRNDAGAFQLDPAAWRVPIGPGLDGAINAIAVSPDGNWLAAAGKSVIAGAADFRNPGRVLPTVGGMSEEMRLDEGTVYVFDLRTRTTYTLRGHRGEVRSLAFAPSTADIPLLVSAAREWKASSGTHIGAVRLWNVTAKAPHLAAQALPEPKHETWPKLAVHRVAAGAKALRVAIAWGDGVFRVWDTTADRMAELPSQGQANDTVVFAESAREFIAGAIGPTGSLRLRSFTTNNATPQLDSARSVELAKPTDAVVAPRGIAALPATAGASNAALALVVHRHFDRDADDRDQYELWLTSAARGARIQPHLLWKAGPPPRRVPVIAAAANGKHLAVSNGAEIHVFALDRLAAAEKLAPQVLRSVGANVRTLAFTRNADRGLGLAISEQATPGQSALTALKPADSIFDITAATLKQHTADDGWKIAPAVQDPWRYQLQGDRLDLTSADKRTVIRWEAGHEVTAVALAGNAKSPVVALATHHNGLPALRLYDATSGEQVRQLSGHSGLIRSLAFSDDGLLLASAADDQTVSLWRLHDLDKIVQKHGLAKGLAVRAADGKLVVDVDAAAAGASELATGDEIVGRVVDGKLLAWKSPREFYDAFWNSLPGETITVRRERAGAASRDVAISVTQGADERKPLLSLFIAREAVDGLRSWIGWSPLGPYQASDEAIEQYLGWHFNTGRIESPVAFARAAQYREKYFREGLIDALIKTGVAPENKQASAPLPRPTMDLVVGDAAGAELSMDLVVDGDAAVTELSGDIVVQTPPASASIVMPGVPVEKIDTVELQLDGKSVGAMQRQADGNTWTAPLDPKLLPRGLHRLKAIVQTRESVPQQFEIERGLRLQARAPQIDLVTRSGPGGIVSERVDFIMAASVTPGEPSEPVEVTLHQYHGKDKTLLRTWTVRDKLDIRENVTLLEGGNVLELVARNQQALAGREEDETTRRRMTINYSAAMPLPTLVDLKIVPLTSDEPVPSGGEQSSSPAVVTIDKVKIAGEITGIEGSLEIASSLGGETTTVGNLAAVGDKPATFNSPEITLQPGVQTILLRRKGAADPAIETQTRIEYRPPLPEVQLDNIASAITLVAGQDAPTLPLSARLIAISHQHPFKAEVVVNGQPIAVEPTIDLQSGKLTASVPLQPGENAIALRLSNAWNAPRDTLVTNVTFLRLPTIDQFSDVSNPQSPTMQFTVSGKSSSEIKTVEITDPTGQTVNLPAAAITYDKAQQSWQATVAQWPLAREPQELTVAVRNADGAARTPGKLVLPAWRQVEPPPSIDIAGGGNVTLAAYELDFAIRSAAPLHAVTLQHNHHIVEYKPALEDLKPDSTGWFTLLGSVPITLEPGDNQFILTASNSGGSQREQLLVNYIDPPARVVIDRLETADLLNKRVLPVVAQNNRAVATSSSPSAKVLVCGRVEWPRSIDQNYLKRMQRLQVWVNGFQQAPIDITPPAPGQLTSEFTAFVVLNQKHENHIQISLPDLTPDVSTLFDAYVDCDNPVVEQRLHLLVVGVGTSPGNEAQLQAEVLKALKARQSERGLRTAAFNRVAIYGPVVGADITPQQVRSHLAMIKLKIDELYKTNKAAVRPANDVVMLYLQGGALASSEGDFYITTKPTSDPRTARALRTLEPRVLMDVGMRSRTLVEFLTHTTGAHVLMLDVMGNQQTERTAIWPRNSRAAMLRYTWLKDSVAPRKARLLAALPEAIEVSGELRQLDVNISKLHDRLANEFPDASAYQRQVPASLEALMLGETSTVMP